MLLLKKYMENKFNKKMITELTKKLDRNKTLNLFNKKTV
jgi:hypothetical protein